MRSLKATLILWMAMCLGNGWCQEFYKSGGIRSFNVGNYKTSIQEINDWLMEHPTEKGIAHYYLAENYYNLGLLENDIKRGLESFQESIRYFELSRPEMSWEDTSLANMIAMKTGWGYFRSSELKANPDSVLRYAFQSFRMVATLRNDTLAPYALYMSGETAYRLAIMYRLAMEKTADPTIMTYDARESMVFINHAIDAFSRVAADIQMPSFIRLCAAERENDVRIESARLYQFMPDVVFDDMPDPEKKRSQKETALEKLHRDRATLRMDGEQIPRYTTDIMAGIENYSRAYRHLLTYLTTREDSELRALNGSLNLMRQSVYEGDARLFGAARDFPKVLTDTLGLRYFRETAGNTPESRLWLGFAHSILNDPKKSVDQFKKYFEATQYTFNDAQTVQLRQEALYWLLFQEFDRNIQNPKGLDSLETAIRTNYRRELRENERINIIYRLVQLGLTKPDPSPIWNRIVEKDYDVAFQIIISLIKKAASSTSGPERTIYFQYLDPLFRITSRLPQKTSFFWGVKTYLQAQGESAENQVRLYQAAAERLNSVLNPSKGSNENLDTQYRTEARYIQARCYFEAGKAAYRYQYDRQSSNEGTESPEILFNRAKQIFVELINRERSLRSVYYLGEIFRFFNQKPAAAQCLEVVKKKTSPGSFWYENTQVVLQEIQSSAEGSRDPQLSDIRIDNVRMYQEEDRAEIILERLADSDYIRREYLDEALTVMMKFGLRKKVIFPSVNRLARTNFDNHLFSGINAGIHEKLENITSCLQILVRFPAGISPEVMVTINGQGTVKDRNGWFTRTNLDIPDSIRVVVYDQGRMCYPVYETYHITKPGKEKRVVLLHQRMAFTNALMTEGNGPKPIRLSERADQNVLMNGISSSIPANSEMIVDFMKNIDHRDFCYSVYHNRFFVLDGGRNRLVVYRNDTDLIREGEMILENGGDVPLNHPEGIATDSTGQFFITDWGNHRLCVFDKDAHFVRSFGSIGENSVNNQGRPIRFLFPTRVVVSQSAEEDRIFFVSDWNGIHWMDRNGNYLDSFAPPEIKKGRFLGLTIQGWGTNSRLFLYNENTAMVEQYSIQKTAGLP